MTDSLVSIIIPTYNRAHLINETLDSVLAQTYQNWECIIIDDGSTDETYKIISQFIEKDNRFQFHNRPQNRIKGANACRNFGIEKGKGEYIMFLDSDDICVSFCLMERVNKMINDPSINLLIRDSALLIDTERQSKSINKDPLGFSIESYLRMFLSYDLPWQTSGAFYKKEILENHKFDENLKRFQDLSFNIKVLSQTNQLKIARDYKIDTYYRDDRNKVFSNGFINNMFESLFVFYNIHFDLFKNTNYKLDFRKFISKIILRFVTVYFYENRGASNKFLIQAIKLNVYTFSQKITLLLLILFLNTSLFKVKSIGMYRLRNKLKEMTSN